MAWTADGRWIPEDDSAATRLTGLLATGGDYLKLARSQGQSAARRRGLQNSTMAAKAGEAAAIGAALPIASQDAQQTAAKNQAYLESGLLYDNQSKLAEQSFQNQTKLNTQQNLQQLTLQEREAEYTKQRDLLLQQGATETQMREFEQRTKEMEANIAAQKATQERDIAARLTLQEREAAAALGLQQAQLSGQLTLQQQEAINQKARDLLLQKGATESQLREFDQRTKEQQANLAAQKETQERELAGQLTLQEREAATRQSLQNSQNQTQLTLQQREAEAALIRQREQTAAQFTMQQREAAAALGLQQAQIAGQLTLQNQDAINQRARDLLLQEGATASQLREFDQRTKEQREQLASAERQAALSADTSLQQTQIGASATLTANYLSAFSNLANNANIPADVRNAYIAKFETVLKQGQQLIGVVGAADLSWGAGSVPAGTPTPAPAPTPAPTPTSGKAYNPFADFDYLGYGRPYGY